MGFRIWGRSGYGGQGGVWGCESNCDVLLSCRTPVATHVPVIGDEQLVQILFPL